MENKASNTEIYNSPTTFGPSSPALLNFIRTHKIGEELQGQFVPQDLKDAAVESYAKTPAYFANISDDYDPRIESMLPFELETRGPRVSSKTYSRDNEAPPPPNPSIIMPQSPPSPHHHDE